MSSYAKSSLPRIAFVLAASCVAGCASVDQFGPRIYDGNINSQNALNQEILLNIVRAARYQSLHFVAVTQVAGGQTETLSTGLPTISLGPHQTAAEHIYQVSNSLSSSSTGSYQSNPLLSTAFQSGILSPVDLRTVALLVGSRPREVVFFALLESIGVKLVTTGEVASLVNDPHRQPAPDDKDIDAAACFREVADTKGRGLVFPGQRCTYAKFVNLLHTLVTLGLSAELVPVSVAPLTPAAATPAAVGAPGRLCFDPTFASVPQKTVTRYYRPLCNAATGSDAAPAGPTTSITTTRKATSGSNETTTAVALTGIPAAKGKPKGISFAFGDLGLVEVTFQLRSPAQVFNYLGAWAREGDSAAFPRYQTVSAGDILRDQPYLDITPAAGPGCYTSIVYAGQLYCVPQTSRHTALLMDVVENLRNLSITPSDLNSAFTVRLQGSP